MNDRELHILELLIEVAKELREEAEGDDKFIFYGGYMFLNLFKKLI